MFISTNSLTTAIAERLATVTTAHLVATFSFGNCHLTKWALLSITEYMLETKKIIDHFKLLFPLFILQLR